MRLKRCHTSSKPSEIEVLPFAVMLSIPLSISYLSYDQSTRLVAFSANDTTEKRDAFMPRGNMSTSPLAKAFDPLGPSMEPLGLGLSFIEPLSSSNRAKSIGTVH